MPLIKSSSKAAFSSNVAEMIKAGHPRDQALAASYATQREAKGRAFGGVAPMLGQAMNSTMPNNNPAMPMGQNPITSPMPQPPINAQASGIMPTPQMQPTMGLNAGMPGPAGARPFALGGQVNPAPKTFKGPIVSAVPGRTDKHFTHVPSGSFVIPADIVSAHGEGNTLAGMNTLNKLFKMGEHSSSPSKIPGSSNALHKLAKGGQANSNVGKPVPVKLAGGEIVVPPEHVHETMQRICKKKLTLEQCHKAMDAWVVNERKKLRKTLAKLPPPAKD